MNNSWFSGPAPRALAAAAGLAFFVMACSLGGTPGTPAVSKGVITAKGSVFVNGVEYADSAASISIGDTANRADSDLKVGMVVVVKGTVNGSSGKGDASEILYAAELQGTIDTSPAINTTTGVFYVFGHKVATDKTTVFDGVVDISGLAAGDRVEVSGTADAASNTLNASRVEKQVPGGDFAIRGVVSALGASSFTLTNEDGKSVIVNFTGSLAAGIANGSLVIVKFAAYSSPLNVTADKVRLITEPKADNGERTEVSGIVSNFASGSPTTFTVDDVNVSADSALVSGVANGVRVEVKGTMQSGVLVADKVKVETESNIEAKGQVTAVDAAAGTLTLDGVLFTTTPRTIFRDDKVAGNSQFSLANIAVNDTLEVSGYADQSSGAVVAAKIERQNGPGQTILSAPVSSIVGSVLTMAGVSVNVSGLSNAAALLAAVTVGAEVTVKGTVSGTTFTATQGSLGG
jgi:hypothetical protein